MEGFVVEDGFWLSHLRERNRRPVLLPAHPPPLYSSSSALLSSLELNDTQVYEP
jgi:hypothetical protein